MSGLSFNQLCSLFCCPPCASEIAAKLAFLPPEPSYSIVSDERSSSRSYSLHLSERAEWQYTQRELDNIEVFLARTERGNQIACMFVRCARDPPYTLLFSHGNAVDLGQMSSFFVALGTRLQCNIFSYDYSGYGMSNGKPSEKNLYADIDCAWHTLRTRYVITPERIVLYGQSIGTVPTVDLAARQRCGGVVLHSPLTSGIRVACHGTRRTWCCDPFPSIEKVARISSPCLVIHGKEDEVIDISHGYAIFERLPATVRVDPLWVEGAGHNDVELYSAYLERLKRLFELELPSLASSVARRISSASSPNPTGNANCNSNSNSKPNATANANVTPKNSTPKNGPAKNPGEKHDATSDSERNPSASDALATAAGDTQSDVARKASSNTYGRPESETVTKRRSGTESNL